MEESYNITDVIGAVRVSAFVVCISGASLNFLVGYLSILASKHESVAYSILFQITAFSNVISTVSGFLVLNRCLSVGPDFAYTLCVPYGPGALLGPRFCNITDALGAWLGFPASPLIAFMMLVRAAIIFGYRMKKRTLIMIAMIANAVFFPIFWYLVVAAYNPTDKLKPEWFEPHLVDIENRTSYVVGGGNEALAIYVNTVWSYSAFLPLACFFFCVPLRIATEVKLRQFAQNISEATKKIHRAFLNVDI